MKVFVISDDNKRKEQVEKHLENLRDILKLDTQFTVYDIPKVSFMHSA